MQLVHDPVTVARYFAYVREAQDLGQNRGARVEAIQRWALGAPGDSWCAEFAIGLVLDICFEGVSPYPRQRDVNASTVSALNYSRVQGWVADTPSVGDLVFSVNADGTPHHVAICTVVDPLTTIAGNTSADGISSNGDRVAEHVISPVNKVFVHYPRGA